MSATVTLEPWGSGDLPLLERLMGDARVTAHLGGPESAAKLRERQDRYERLKGGDRMFKIVDVATGVGVGFSLPVGWRCAWSRWWRRALVSSAAIPLTSCAIEVTTVPPARSPPPACASNRARRSST